ncbi:enoyl-CoA hydratase/isomerase family protein [Streptomyces sp. CB01881]|uniref:enoyl-CoA hydratase/isomerase family protein n=1 Tax=Streptomyces sp. CB01881 TaxID=2078691 RepID=UPI000CDC8812|nr:enoyl-CoA hydratase/isomerase family protein [Streptomyces sp. CB01881]AUY49054.1 3-hydroxyisobutyryl-CoA hydrolase [Streptomyces sp. CB01881]TYC77545.1 enoyl-CoA hydratase/isomerase family protein [Streptomyces sp. CB01881]
MGAEVLVHQDGGVGRIVLDRPRALNSLTHGMITAVHAALEEWAADDTVRAVVLTGAGERGLCAGADIRAIHEDAKAGGAGSRAFFRDEYRLNALIARYPKPYLAVMDGITMGGGVGLSAHGAVRIVTERSTVAMPETRIGLVPDVGGSRLLAHAPGGLGTHLGLTSASMGPGDALLCGFADHFVHSARIPALLADLTARLAGPATGAAAAVTAAVTAHAEAAPPAALAAQRAWIDACYGADTAEEIVARLLDTGLPEAKEAAEQVLGNSPTAVKVTLAALRRARTLPSLEAVLDQEYRISCAALAGHDLVEGIRAQVVDKDRNPRWSPAGLAGVSEAEVARHFAPRGDDELGLA